MKKILKKANRGLLLSAVVLSILTIYVIADYVSFQSQKDTINQVIINYYDEICKTNVEPDALSAAHHEKVKDIIQTYWSDADTSLNWSTTKSDMMNFATELFTGDDIVYDITDVDYKTQNIKIKKTGPGYASVTLKYTTSITGMSDSHILTPSNLRVMSDSSEDYYEDVETAIDTPESSENISQKGILTYSANVTIELHKDNGEWKICAIDAYENSSSFNNINE